MLDQSINEESLAFAISARERYKYKSEFVNGDEDVIERCLEFYKTKKEFPNLLEAVLKGKKVYQTRDVILDVLIRRLNLSLKTINHVKQQDRNNIIKSIIGLLKEHNRYSIIRLDIKSFYESVDRDYILRKLEDDPAYSITTIDILKRLNHCFEASNVTGLPRGLSISATLSEYLLRPFDNTVKQMDGVFYYARFVDDILIISSRNATTFSKEVEKLLPHFLHFSNKPHKKTATEVGYFNKNSLGEKACFEYLGYKFTVTDIKKEGRVLAVDIADSKIRKIKTKIVKSLLDYGNNDDFGLLKKRIRLLTSNFYLSNKYRSTKVRSGIYYNYRYINACDTHKSNLLELDDYLRAIIFKNDVAVKCLLSPIGLSKNQKAEIVKLSFVCGHMKKIFHRFTPLQMRAIKKCWYT